MKKDEIKVPPRKKGEGLTTKLARHGKTFKLAVESFAQFVEGVMLAVISIFAMYMSYYHYHLDHWTALVLFGSGAGMTILAFGLLGKHFVSKATREEK